MRSELNTAVPEIVFRLRRGARRRIRSLAALTIEVRLDFDMDGAKSAYVVGEAPTDPSGYTRTAIGATTVYVRTETFTGLRLTRLREPSRIALRPAGRGLEADVTFGVAR